MDSTLTTFTLNALPLTALVLGAFTLCPLVLSTLAVSAITISTLASSALTLQTAALAKLACCVFVISISGVALSAFSLRADAGIVLVQGTRTLDAIASAACAGAALEEHTLSPSRRTASALPHPLTFARQALRIQLLLAARARHVLRNSGPRHRRSRR